MNNKSLGLVAAALLSWAPLCAAQNFPPVLVGEVERRLDEIAKLHKNIQEAFAPASIDPGQFSKLVSHFAEEGIVSSSGKGTPLVTLEGNPIVQPADGTMTHLKADIVEYDLPQTDLVYRRAFGRVNIEFSRIRLEPPTKNGIMEIWHIVLNPSGQILDVRSRALPGVLIAPGKFEVKDNDATETFWRPSSDTAKEIWKEIYPKLMALGRVYDV
jgi:hypothetical protein